MKTGLLTAVISFFCFGSALIAAEPKAQLIPAREDLIGIWAPDKAALQEIEKQAPNRAPPEIELLSRGSVRMLNIPGWWRNVFDRPEGGVEGFVGGTWEIKSGKSGPQLLFQHSTFGSMVLSVEGQQPPYSLVLHVGGTLGNAPVKFYRKSGELNPPHQK